MTAVILIAIMKIPFGLEMQARGNPTYPRAVNPKSRTKFQGRFPLRKFNGTVTRRVGLYRQRRVAMLTARDGPAFETEGAQGQKLAEVRADAENCRRCD